ncbi:hypothetical protein WICPIJ_000208, partial [Wickerhamomyces pijperi]
ILQIINYPHRNSNFVSSSGLALEAGEYNGPNGSWLEPVLFIDHEFKVDDIVILFPRLKLYTDPQRSSTVLAG